jgi:hypothetical protein
MLARPRLIDSLTCSCKHRVHLGMIAASGIDSDDSRCFVHPAVPNHSGFPAGAANPVGADMAGEGRDTPSRPERRDLATRAGGGAWTQTERDRFIAEVREARRDAKAVTIQGGAVVENPQVRRRIRRGPR